MSNVDWFRRKLAETQGQPAPPPQPNSYPPQMYTPSPPPPVQSPNIGHQQPMVSPQGADMTQQFTMEGVGDAIRNWQGDTKKGAAAVERSRCPNCGSDKYFSRTNASGATTQQGKVPPAPHCFECGHNGLFEQYGAQLPE